MENLLELYNKMLKEGKFSKVWKTEITKIFVNPLDKVLRLVKSYRLVMRLPLLGKIGKRRVTRQMNNWLLNGERAQQIQYGFTHGMA